MGEGGLSATSWKKIIWKEICEMSTIIVFSKDRPMQLHGYLESIIRASGCREEQIYVLYKEILPVRYDKVIRFFSGVNWIPEVDFDIQLREIVEKADDYIVFGCDDVVFTDQFDLLQMEKYLEEDEEVFGFSLRLGQNIKPAPKKIKSISQIRSWNWVDNTGHYGYPWELDCTMYRKDDVLGILGQIGKVGSPNYLESIPEENRAAYIKRPGLASYAGDSKAMVITVNRVQDTHPNQVDDSKATDVISLFIQYQYEGRTLDLDRMWACKRQQVHVGSEYLFLTPSVKESDGLQGRKHSKWYWMVQNLRLLGAGGLEQIMQSSRRDDMIISDLRLLAAAGQAQMVKSPMGFGPEETIRKLAEHPKSFCRFGDGEFTLMMGGSIGFQKYDPKLALALWEVFCEADDNLYIGVPYQQFEAPERFNPWIREFYYTSGRWVRKFLHRYLPRNREEYIDTGFNQVYQTYLDMDFSKYYEQVKRLFLGKKITVIAGEGILEKLTYDIFEYADETEYLFGPKSNAFEEYASLREGALQTEKDRLVCVILGPCSKVLVRDMTKAGYMTWDIGHLAKDYDAYRRRFGRTREDIAGFYAPD